MNRDRTSSSNDPTAERAVPQSTQSAAGLSEVIHTGDRRDERADIVAREAFDDTPRRYEQPIEADDDPVMPSDDSTLNTKI